MPSNFYIQPGDLSQGLNGLSALIEHQQQLKKQEEAANLQKQFREGTAQAFGGGALGGEGGLPGLEEMLAEKAQQEQMPSYGQGQGMFPAKQEQDHAGNIMYDFSMDSITNPATAAFSKKALDDIGITPDKYGEVNSFAEEVNNTPDAELPSVIKKRIAMVVDRGGDASHTAQLLAMSPEEARNHVAVADTIARREGIRKMMQSDPAQAQKMLLDWQEQKTKAAALKDKTQRDTDFDKKIREFQTWQDMPEGKEKEAYGMLIGASPKVRSIEDTLKIKGGEADIDVNTLARKQGVTLATQPEIEERIAKAKESGKGSGETVNLLKDMESSMPALYEVADRLNELSSKATYTMTGKAYNTVARELGFNVPEGATARASYISVIDNEVLPLLRQTFGAAFTEREGSSLKATLGDPDKSPAEKQAQLDSFIKAKERQIRSLQRKTGAQVNPDKNNASQHDEALDWAKSNPSDPRAIRILKLHGM